MRSYRLKKTRSLFNPFPKVKLSHKKMKGREYLNLLSIFIIRAWILVSTIYICWELISTTFSLWVWAQPPKEFLGDENFVRAEVFETFTDARIEVGRRKNVLCVSAAVARVVSAACGQEAQRKQRDRGDGKRFVSAILQGPDYSLRASWAGFNGRQAGF